MMIAFRLLARLKGLRGTPFDIFGKTQERRHERELVNDYFALIDELIRTVNEETLSTAIQLARLPDDIRGFGHVKEKNRMAAQQKRSELLQQFRDAAPLERVA